MATLEELATEWAEQSPYEAGAARPDTEVGSVKISAGPGGSRMITGEGEKPAPKLKASIPLDPATISPSNAGLDSSRILFENIDKQIEIIKGGDTKAGAQALAEARGAIAATKARFEKEARTTAHAEFGVPQLLEELKFNEQQDRMDPDYIRFRKDSSITAEVRAKAAQMKGAADGSIPERLKGNEAYQTLAAKADTLASIGASYLQKTLGKEALREAEADNFMDSLGVEGQRRASVLFPQESKNPAVLMGYVKNKENGRELDAILKAPEKDIPVLALKGSAVARELLKRDETRKIGPQAQLLLEEGYRIADDPLKAKEALKFLENSGYTKGWSEADKQRALSATSDIGIKGSKEDKELMQEERARIAKAVMTVKHQNQFDSDMLKLPSDEALPAFLKLAQQDPALNISGKISKNEAIALANRADDIAVRQQNINELVNFYSSAADKVSKSSLFNINPLSVDKIRAEASTGRLASFFKPLGDVLQPVANAANLTGLAIGSAARLPGEFLFGDQDVPLSEVPNQAILKTINACNTTNPAMLRIKAQLLGGNK